MEVKGFPLLAVMATLAGLVTKVVQGSQLAVISNLNIETDVDRRYATTHVMSRMKNPADVSQELVFKMKLPKTAFVSSLIMEIEGRNYTSNVQEKEAAKKTYQKAKSRGKSTGLVEQSLKNFQVSANVGAHQKVTFYLKYEELLQRVKGVYNLTINVKPGHEVEELMLKVSIKETARLTKFTLQETPGSEITSPTPVDWKTTHVKGISPLKLFWASRQEVKLLYHRSNRKDKGTDPISEGVLSLSYDLARTPDGGEVQIEDNFFAHYFSPEGLPLLPKHTVFVIDVSGSMGGNKLENVKKAMEAILKDMKRKDSFEVMTFSDNVKSLGVFDGKKKSVKKSLKKVNKLDTEGGTNINQGLLDAVANLQQMKRNNTATQMVFLTDGSPTTGVTDLKTIRQNVRAANEDRQSIFSLAFGEGADLNFLRQISSDNQGFARKIYEHSSPSEQLTGFYDEISKPLLMNVDLAYGDDSVDSDSLVRSGHQTYYAGDEVVVTGKLLPGVTHLEPEVSGYGKNGQVQLSVSRTELESPTPDRENMIERLWAYMTVQDLIRKMDVEENQTKKNEMKAKALQIALEYNFVTKLTSLVVVRPEDLKEDPEEASEEASEDASNDIRGHQVTPPTLHSQKSKARRQHGMAAIRRNKAPSYDYGNVAPFQDRTMSAVYHSPRQSSVDRDPHFLVYAKNSLVPYCFDFHGKSGDVLSLVQDSTSGIIINGLVTSSLSKNGKTFFTKLFFSLGKVNITFTPFDLKVDCPATTDSLWFEEPRDPVTLRREKRRISRLQRTSEDLNDKEFSVYAHSAEVKTHPKCNRSLSWEDGDGYRFLDVHLELWKKNKFIIVLGDTLARFIVTRSKSKRKQDFLGIYIDRQDILSPNTTGILGQFKYKIVPTTAPASETPDLEGRSQRPLAGTTQEDEEPNPLVKTFSARRLSGLVREKIPCLFVRGWGKGLLTGRRRDYILPCLQC